MLPKILRTVMLTRQNSHRIWAAGKASISNNTQLTITKSTCPSHEGDWESYFSKQVSRADLKHVTQDYTTSHSAMK